MNDKNFFLSLIKVLQVMTAEEAIDILWKMNSMVWRSGERGAEAVEMAAKALRMMHSPLSYNLEEEIEHYQSTVFPDRETVPRIAQHFALWQKEQIMKNAKSGVVIDNNQISLGNNMWIDLDPSMRKTPAFSFEKGDKVKIVIIKEK